MLTAIVMMEEVLAGVDLVRPVALPSDQYCYISDSQSKGNVKSVHVLYIIPSIRHDDEF